MYTRPVAIPVSEREVAPMGHSGAAERRTDVAYVLVKLRVRGAEHLLLNAHRKLGDWSLIGGQRYSRSSIRPMLPTSGKHGSLPARSGTCSSLKRSKPLPLESGCIACGTSKFRRRERHRPPKREERARRFLSGVPRGRARPGAARARIRARDGRARQSGDGRASAPSAVPSARSAARGVSLLSLGAI
jgi:hypothetical protein